MPLFSRNRPSLSNQPTNTSASAPAPAPAAATDPSHRRSLFRSSPNSTAPSPNPNGGLTNGAPTNTSPQRSSILRHDAEDASITAARERVMSAEAAEKDADKALLNARAAVREAREQVKILEREAGEQ